MASSTPGGFPASPYPDSPAIPLDASLPVSPSAEEPAATEVPLTTAASTILMNLPRDATAALETAGAFTKDRVKVRFKPVGSAPPLRKDKQVVTVKSTQTFDYVIAFVRKQLKVQATESLFVYVNSTFAPALDEVVGNLWLCFKDASDQLNISYSMTPAFG